LPAKTGGLEMLRLTIQLAAHRAADLLEHFHDIRVLTAETITTKSPRPPSKNSENFSFFPDLKPGVLRVLAVKTRLAVGNALFD
jgi:hypothetical protein